MVTECIRGDHRPLGRSREGLPQVMCQEHVRTVEDREAHDPWSGGTVVDHLDAVVTWADGVGVAAG